MPIDYASLISAEAAATRESSSGSLPELFLENTKLRRHDAPGFLERQRRLEADSDFQQLVQQSVKGYPTRRRLRLPTTRDERITRPESTNAATTPAPLPLAALSQLLDDTHRTAATPLAKGAQPLEIYVVARQVTGVEPGSYHYHPTDHALETVMAADLETLDARLGALMPGAEPVTAAALVILTAVPLRLAYIYGDRGYRSVLLAAGRTAQKLEVGAHTLGLGARPTETFFDEAVHRLLDLDGVDELAVALCWLDGPAVDSAADGAAEARRLLTSDEDSLVLTGVDALHVVNRCGTFDLKAKGIHLLHQRLAPFLDGRYDEKSLVAAVPPSRAGAVRSYLAKLREVGALHDSRSPRTGDDSIAELGPRRPWGRFRYRGTDIDVSLDGPLPSPGQRQPARLCFVTPEDAGRWLLTLEGPEKRLGNQICVVAESASTEAASSAELGRRAAIARWLIHSTLGPESPEESFRLYRESSNGALAEILRLDRRDDERLDRSLPEQLELIRSADADQLPLVVATASHPFFEPSITRFGTEYPEVRDQLLQEFLVQAKLASISTERCTRFFRGELGAALSSYVPVSVSGTDAVRLSVAGSRLELEALLLEQVARRTTDDRSLTWRQIDLLAEPSDHPQIICLQQLLRLRLEHLPARRTVTPEGVTVLADDSNRASSLIADKAMAEILLTAVWGHFYGLGAVSSAAPACGYSQFADSTELERRVRHAAAGARLPRVVIRRLRCWGVTAWTGELDESVIRQGDT